MPYLYNAQTKVFVTYEDPQSLAAKCTYVTDHKLSGIMFWEYFNDSTGILLDAVHAGLSPTTSAPIEGDEPWPAHPGWSRRASHIQAPRIVSIDVFRGLTMIVMIFVNDLAS